MALDSNLIRQGVNSIGDYQRLQQEFELKKQLAQADLMKAQSGGNLPAALQIADEYGKARAAGDTQRMNDIAIAAKSFDRGVIYDQNGNPVAMGGYGDAVGSIAGVKKAYEAQAQNSSDLAYDPQIAGGEQRARLEEQLKYEPLITGAQRQATTAADVQAEEAKKTRQDVSMTGSIKRARQYLPNATSGKIENIFSTGARAIGKSTEKTQADAQLEVIAAELVQNVPRFEGPQSNIDVQFYKDAAADVGNPNKTAEDRLAALSAIEERIKLRQQQGLIGGQGEPQGAVNDQQFNDYPVQPLSMDDLNTVPSAANPMGTDLMQRAEQEFNAKKGNGLTPQEQQELDELRKRFAR